MFCSPIWSKLADLSIPFQPLHRLLQILLVGSNVNPGGVQDGMAQQGGHTIFYAAVIPPIKRRYSADKR